MLSIEETILCAFRKRLRSKDERVAELEKKFVEMSFELASMKALADEHGAKRMFLADEHGAMQTLLRLLLSKLTQLFVSFRIAGTRKQVHRQLVISLGSIQCFCIFFAR